MIYDMRCGVKLLITHEAKLSAVSCNETHTLSAFMFDHLLHICIYC